MVKLELKSYSTLKLLALLEIGIGLLLIIFESIVNGLVVWSGYLARQECYYGTGIWVGVIGIIAGLFGLMAFRTKFGNVSLMTVHFVMCIFAAVADAVLITMASICLSSLPWSVPQYYYVRNVPYTHPPAAYHTQRSAIAFASFLVIFGLVHMICCVLSTAFICRNWCRTVSPSSNVIYLPARDGIEKDQIPLSSQVVFIKTEQKVA